MLSNAMQEKLIEQIGKEWESEYYYMSMGAWCYNHDLDGFGAWFERQAGEEHMHGLKFFHYVRDAGGDVAVPALAPMPADFASLEDVYVKTLEHERKVTGLINALVTLARGESDHATDHFLQWFVNEQIEEESTARAILSKVKRSGDNPSALFLLEQQIAPPAAASAEPPAGA